jgi:hypothetical protein
MAAPLFLNKIFPRGPGDNGRFDNRLLDSTVVGHLNFNDHRTLILSLRFDDFC